MSDAPPRTIVLVHGLWLSSLSWEHWVTRYAARGHRVLTPEWPYMDRDIEELRRDPSAMNGLGVSEIADSYAAFLRGLDEPPILMGHSFGGLLVQQLLDRGLGSAGVAIDPAPIKGVKRLPLSSLRTAFPALRNPATRKRTVGLTRAQWHYGFANTLSREESDALYDRYQVPSPGRPLWQAATAAFTSKAATAVNVHNDDRAPLLILAGGADHTVPPAVNRENVKLYRKSTAVTDFHEFPGRPHFTGAAPGWEAVADYALEWALTHDSETRPTAVG